MLHLSHYKIIYHHILNIFHFLVHAYSMLHILECLLWVIQTRIFMFMNLHVPCNTCVLSFWGKPDRFPLWYLLEQGKSGDDLKLHILLSHPSICKKKFQLYNTQFMKRQNHMSILVYIHTLYMYIDTLWCKTRNIFLKSHFKVLFTCLHIQYYEHHTLVTFL